MLSPPPTTELIRANAKFHTLKTLEPVPPNLKRPPLPLYMYTDSIRLIDKPVVLLRDPCHSRNMVRGPTRAVRRSLMVDSQRRV